MIYLIKRHALVEGFSNVKAARSAYLLELGSYLIRNEDDLWDVPMSILVNLYNRAANIGGGRPITHFHTYEDASARVFPCLDFLAQIKP